jgi:metal-responsive CopG/Arc/MetJ family transcriptional regulator
MRRKKVSVLLDEAEYEKFEFFCRDRGYKKSTLISKLIRDLLTSDGHRALRVPPRAKAKKSSLK